MDDLRKVHYYARPATAITAIEELEAEVKQLRTRNAKLVALLREAGDGDCPFCEKVGGEDGHWNDCPLGAALKEDGND